MIGNDVVDLGLSRIESNWQRKGFLDKIFTKNEQDLIKKSENQEITVWNLWSRKEAAYKIWNRETGIRKYNPIQFECFDLDLETGKVQIENFIYFIKTEINTDFIHTIAASSSNLFDEIIFLNRYVKIEKQNEIPFYITKNQEKKSVSKSHHGKYEFIVGLRNS